MDDIIFNPRAGLSVYGGLNYKEPYARATASRAPLDAAAGGVDASQDAFDQQFQSIGGLFDTVNDRLRARMAAGDSKGERMERLLMLAAALGQPTRTGSFGEQLGNFTNTYATTLRDSRERKEKLQEQLEQNELARAMTYAKLKGEYLIQKAKPRTRRTGFDQYNVLRYMDTGEPVVADEDTEADVSNYPSLAPNEF